MSWNYSGRPESSQRDQVRLLVGDTDKSRPLAQDEEIAFCLSKYSTIELAAALLLRALAAKYSHDSSFRVGDVSVTMDKISDALAKRADELDPHKLTASAALLILPSFGGLTISGKETMVEDTDTVQPRFIRGQDDIEGGPDDSKRFWPWPEIE